MSDDLRAWLTVEAAALAYGCSARTIRRRIKGGQVEARQVETQGGPGYEWRVQPPGSHQNHTRDQEPQTPGTSALIPLDQLERLLAPLAVERDRLAGELAGERDRHRAEIGDLQSARLADKEEIGRLRGLLEAAQGELERLRAVEASTPTTELQSSEKPRESTQTHAPEPTKTYQNPLVSRRRWRLPWQK